MSPVEEVKCTCMYIFMMSWAWCPHRRRGILLCLDCYRTRIDRFIRDQRGPQFPVPLFSCFVQRCIVFVVKLLDIALLSFQREAKHAKTVW